MYKCIYSETFLELYIETFCCITILTNFNVNMQSTSDLDIDTLRKSIRLILQVVMTNIFCGEKYNDLIIWPNKVFCWCSYATYVPIQIVLYNSFKNIKQNVQFSNFFTLFLWLRVTNFCSDIEKFRIKGIEAFNIYYDHLSDKTQ